MSVKKEKDAKIIETKRDFISTVLGIYVFLIMVALPLVIRNKYFDILVTKYYFYCICTIAMLILVLFFVFDDRTRIFSLFKPLQSDKLLKGSDYAALMFLLISIISTVSSDYVYESFWGNEGRFTGLFLISLYVISYFCVSRFWKFKSWYFNWFLFAGILVCIFGITDYFQMDILQFKVHILESQKPIFTSTLGNINTYTAYVGIIMAASMVLFTTSRKTIQMIWYYIGMVISFFAIIMGVSDNAYLSLAALFGLLPLYLFRYKRGIKRYLVVLVTFFTVIQCIDWINIYWKDTVLGIDSTFNMLVAFKGLHYLVLGLWIITAFWYYIDIKHKTVEKDYGNVFRYAWLGVIALIVLVFLYMLYDSNIAGNYERYGKLSSYFLFNDEWGTHRGYIWRNAMECFSKFPLWKKIIGYGPETFGILLLRKTANNQYLEIFDNAHNEYLHCLITVGIAGVTSYVALLLACIRNCFRSGKNNPYIIATAFGIICYSTQAFVNLNLPITAPIVWLLLGIGSAKSIEE
jgi:hypothetical protein